MTKWYAIRTNIKCEQKAARELSAEGFEVYLPEQKIERFNRKKRVPVVTTLCVFPRYLFVRLDMTQFRAARMCNGVEDILPGKPYDPLPIRGKDAEAIEKLREDQRQFKLDDTDEARRYRGETTKNTLAAMRKRLRDKTVSIRAGAFAGFTATVEEVHTIDRLRLVLSIFGRPTVVDLDAESIDPLDLTQAAA